MIVQTLLNAINAKKLDVEQLLQRENIEPQPLLDIFQSLIPLIESLTSLAETEEQAREQLLDLDAWYNLMIPKVESYKLNTADNIKQINIARKASHHYRINR